MAQYCRYCSNMVCGDANYCTEKQNCYDDKYLKQPNRCKLYQHNPVDALGENVKGYKPLPKIIKITPDMDIAQIALAIFGETERT